jgi:hypothetical protein
MKSMTLIFISLLSVIGIFLMPAIPQELLYHQFADQRLLFGIPHIFDTLSNIPYLIIGSLGLRLLYSGKKIELIDSIRTVYGLFFISVFLVGLGSSYYHLSPNNSTLLWDRLPMVVAFLSFFTIIMAEYINEKLAVKLLLPLLIIGVGSVLYWYWTESIGQGDLRLYVLVQFLPMLLIPVIFVLYTSQFTLSYFFWLVLVCYALAKGFELMDFEVYELTRTFTGHNLKHLVSAAGVFMFYLALQKRDRIK